MKTVILTSIASFMLLTGLSGQWEIVNDGSDAIYAIDFIDDSTGWMAGNEGYLIKTVDGGNTWTDISINEKRNFSSINFINDTLGWAICSDSVLKSTDGGMNWEIQHGIKAIKLSIIDEQTVYAISRTSVYKTTDGGLNWFDISPVDISKLDLENIYFINNNTGIVKGCSNTGYDWK
jgi:photosystem II stability/assembly factor-like uncharacterized protein